MRSTIAWSVRRSGSDSGGGGLSVERIDILFELDMHYVGQTHTVSVPPPVSVQNGTTGIDGAVVRQAFERSYQTSFSRLPGVPAKIVNLRTAAVGRRPHFDLAALAPAVSANLEAARLGSRQVWFDGAWHDTAIYNRLDLPVDAVVHGPAILEQPDATTVIDPDLVAFVDPSATSSWSVRHERGGHPHRAHGASSLICRTTSSTRKAPMAGPGRARRTSESCRSG